MVELEEGCNCADKIKEQSVASCGCQKAKKAPAACCCEQKTEESSVSSCCEQKIEKAPATSCCTQKSEKNTAASCGCHKSPPAALAQHSKTEGCCSTNSAHNQKNHAPASCGCCETAPKKDTFWGKYKNYIILSVSLVSLIVSYLFTLFESWHVGILHYIDFGSIAIILCGIPIMIKAVKNLAYGKGFSGKVTSALLVSVAILACITLEVFLLTGLIAGDGHSHSYIFAAGEIAFLMRLGGVIEAFTVGKARAGIDNLVKLTPASAKYMLDGVIVEKPLSEVRVGDRVLIMPDDMISVDGIVVEGCTAADESIMTGESVPVDKNPGDHVYGGTWNKGGAITVEVTKAEDSMAITKLKRLVEEAEGKKAPVSRLAEKAASFIVPAAIVFGILIFFLNYLLMGKWIFADSIIGCVERGVTMLVVFCPCALALATPVAVAAGLGNAARNGILIKSGAALEELGRVKAVAFDKTGTLTEGLLKVDEIMALGVSEEYLARRAAAAESLSGHPIAKAISALHPTEKAVSVKSTAGFGVESVVEGNTVTVAKWGALDLQSASGSAAGVDSDRLSERANMLMEQGKRVVAVAENGALIGLIALSDTLREGAAGCIASLSAMGITGYMLTGDNPKAAQHIAQKAGIQDSNVFAALTPEEKLQKTGQIKAAQSVCMIGDGVNDAPALAAASCSLAMGALGSDAAIETASAALMTSDIKKVPFLFRLGRKVLRTIKINIAFSMTVNFVSVLLSAFGIINPAWGALIHNASSVIVAINSAFLLRTK